MTQPKNSLDPAAAQAQQIAVQVYEAYAAGEDALQRMQNLALAMREIASIKGRSVTQDPQAKLDILAGLSQEALYLAESLGGTFQSHADDWRDKAEAMRGGAA